MAYRLTERLAEEGFYIADIRAVDQEIRSGSVRYFFPEDRGDSEAVVEALRDFYDEEGLGEPPQAPRPFFAYSPKPHDGTIEVWLPTR